MDSFFKKGNASSAIVNACFVAIAASFSCSLKIIPISAVNIAIPMLFESTKGKPIILITSTISFFQG